MVTVGLNETSMPRQCERGGRIIMKVVFVGVLGTLLCLSPFIGAGGSCILSHTSFYSAE